MLSADLRLPLSKLGWVLAPLVFAFVGLLVIYAANMALTGRKETRGIRHRVEPPVPAWPRARPGCLRQTRGPCVIAASQRLLTVTEQ
jgi:hypothetical protein